MRVCVVVLLFVTLARSQESRPPLALTGEVRDPAGKPAAGARVRLIRWRNETLPACFRAVPDEGIELGQVVTGTDGRFHTPLAEGQVVGVMAEDGDGLASLPHGPLLAGDPVVLELRPVRELRGTVVRPAADGSSPAVAGAMVEVRAPLAGPPAGQSAYETRERHWALRTVSNADGSFALRLPAFPASTPLAWIATHGGAVTRVERRADQPIELRFSGTVRTGQLVDERTGAAIADARVEVAFRSPAAATRSDAQGRFALAVDDHDSLVVIPRNHQRAVLTPRDLTHAGVEPPQRVALAGGLARRVRFVRADGSPVADAPVALEGTVLFQRQAYGRVDWCERSDAQGLLRLGCLQAGQWFSAWVLLDGIWHLGVQERPSVAGDLGDVLLAPTARLSGMVLDPSGAPAAHAAVLVRPDPPEAAGRRPFDPIPCSTLRTDRLGRFVAPGVLPGRYRLAATSAVHGPVLGVATAGAAGPITTLALTPGATITGTVNDPTGVAAGVELSARILNAPDPDCTRFGLIALTTTTDATGRFTLRGVPQWALAELTATQPMPAAAPWRYATAAKVKAGSQGLELQLR